MRPVLIVEGVVHKVRILHYNHEGEIEAVAYTDDGKYVHVVDISNRTDLTNSRVMDLSKVLIWNDRYQPIYEALDNVISDECNKLKELAIKHVESDNPFDMDYQKEYKQLQQKVFGLIDAQELVTEFMVDDVDLSGGEEIE